jgi:hypothetical protein
MCRRQRFYVYTKIEPSSKAVARIIKGVYWEQEKLRFESQKFFGHVLLPNNIICLEHNMSIFYICYG